MSRFGRTAFVLRASLLLGIFVAAPASSEERPRAQPSSPLDEKVQAFLAQHASRWYDMNVPARDGRFMNDLITEHGYTRALEIGTSTGHSGIWIAWALSRTGGKLITIEIDPERRRQALANFEAAGVSSFVDSRLADAHELVRQLPGPFDFVFSDADKGWLKQYFRDLAPKMAPGGCYVTHNVGMHGVGPDYVDFLKRQPGFETTVETTQTSGISLTFRKRD